MNTQTNKTRRSIFFTPEISQHDCKACVTQSQLQVRFWLCAKTEDKRWHRFILKVTLTDDYFTGAVWHEGGWPVGRTGQRWKDRTLAYWLFSLLYYVYGHFACIYVCALCVCLVPPRPEEDVRSPRNRVIGNSEPTCRSWDLNSGSL